MFNNVALDVVIGLVFIYLLYSLLGTLIQEIIATKIGLRGFVLNMAIKRMLDDTPEFKNADSKPIVGYFNKIKKIISKKEKHQAINCKIDDIVDEVEEFLSAGNTNETKVSSAFYAHPLIKYLRADALFLRKKPSYIDQETFSKVLIDLLRGPNARPGSSDRHLIEHSLEHGEIAWKVQGDSLVAGKDLTEQQRKLPNAKLEYDTLLYLRSVWADSQGDVAKFRSYLEAWFNEMMDRATGWYKKYTQLLLFGVGLIISVSFNLDTFKIAKQLQVNPEMRNQIIAQVSNFTKSHREMDKQLSAAKEDPKKLSSSKPNDSKAKDQRNVAIESLNPNIDNNLNKKLQDQETELVENYLPDAMHTLAIGWDKETFSKTFLPFFDCNWVVAVAGWILTALAISMGAPFWFDLLNKFMQLRSSLAPKDDEKAKSTNVAPKTIERVG